MLNISKAILVRTDSNMCRKELTVHWSAPNSLIRSYLQPWTNSMWEDESEAVAPIIWLYQTVDAQNEEVFFPDLLITLRRYGHVIHKVTAVVTHKHQVYATFETHAAVSSCHKKTTWVGQCRILHCALWVYKGAKNLQVKDNECIPTYDFFISTIIFTGNCIVHNLVLFLFVLLTTVFN